MDRAYNIEGVIAAIDSVKRVNRDLAQENEQLRGALAEARREARRLRHRLEHRPYTAEYLRHIVAASVGIAVALTCLLHSIVITWGGWAW